MDDLNTITNLIARFRRRLTFAEAIRAGLSAILWGGVAASILIVAAKVCGLSRGVAAFSFCAIPAAFLVGLAMGWKHSFRSPYAAAKLLDKHLGLNDRLANAHYFLLKDQGKAGRSSLAALAIQDGLNAARNAKLGRIPNLLWPRSATLGLLISAVCVGWLYLLYPPHIVPTEQAVTQETQNEMLNMIQGLQDLPGVSAEQKDDIKKMLESMNISEAEMKKMTSADLMRLISAKGIDYKGGGGATAFEAMKNAVADLDQIRQQHDEFERKNKESYQFVLANGQKVTGVRIATQAPTEQIVRDRVQRSMGIKAAVESEELEQLQRQTELSAANTKAARGKIGLKTTAVAIDASALLATDEKYQKDRDTAIDDPKSEAALRVKRANQDLLNREIEKGDIPSATAEKLKNWMRLESGPAKKEEHR